MSQLISFAKLATAHSYQKTKSSCLLVARRFRIRSVQLAPRSGKYMAMMHIIMPRCTHAHAQARYVCM